MVTVQYPVLPLEDMEVRTGQIENQPAKYSEGPRVSEALGDPQMLARGIARGPPLRTQRWAPPVENQHWGPLRFLAKLLSTIAETNRARASDIGEDSSDRRDWNR
jgi:hypothetical protein